MRALITNFGSTGDIQPLLGLAIDLRRHGHQAIVALAPNFKARAKDLGLEFVSLGPDLQKVQQQVIKSLLELPNSAETLRSLFAPLVAALPQVFCELRDACVAADVLISGAAQPAARMVHEVSGIPFVSVQFAHMFGTGTPALQQASSSLINPVRARFGLAPLKHPLTVDANSPQLALYAVSRYILPPPSDWPQHYHMTGYFFLDEPDWQPGPDLESFMVSGPPPVVITLGSTTYEDRDSLGGLVLEAIRIAGCRAVIQHGWGGLLLQKELPPSVYSAGFVPHDRLFPRASCVVHHGGAGTAASAFRAGVPSLFITHGPTARAQVANELGVAGPPISYWELSAERLGRAIASILKTESYYQAAATLGKNIRAEQGVKKARQLIEEFVCKVGLQHLPQSYASQVAGGEEKIFKRRRYQQMRRAHKVR